MSARARLGPVTARVSGMLLLGRQHPHRRHATAEKAYSNIIMMEADGILFVSSDSGPGRRTSAIGAKYCRGGKSFQVRARLSSSQLTCRRAATAMESALITAAREVAGHTVGAANRRMQDY